MKINIIKIIAMYLIVSLFFISCFTTYDRGIYNPYGLSEEDFIILHIDKTIIVEKMNNEIVNWVNINVWSNQFQIVKISPGVHTFHAEYSYGGYYTRGASPVSGVFESGNNYLLIGKPNAAKTIVSYHIYLYNDNKLGDEITDRRSREGIFMANYLNQVLHPARSNSIALENNEYILVFKPNMIYTLTNKTTGITIEGKTSFETDAAFKNVKIYLFETNVSIMTTEQFLDSGYRENSQIILSLRACTATEVTYRYEKHADLHGAEVKFNINKN
ncbi:MAG: hypothetical protein FWD14_04565 [Treponema sp.]|nr:hypothetical protein [Treponema sp.]